MKKEEHQKKNNKEVRFIDKNRQSKYKGMLMIPRRKKWNTELKGKKRFIQKKIE